MSYVFNVCRSVDQKITAERRASISHSHPSIETKTPNTGALIFGRRFSFSHVALPTNIPSSSVEAEPTPMDQQN